MNPKQAKIVRAYNAGDSFPPEAEEELSLRQNRAFADADTPTGVHNLQRLVTLAGERAAALDKDRADKAEAALAERAREDREFVRHVKVGVIVTAFGAALSGVCALLYELAQILPHH